MIEWLPLEGEDQGSNPGLRYGYVWPEAALVYTPHGVVSPGRYVCCNISMVLLQGDFKVRNTLYLVFYVRASKVHHTGGKCVIYCGLSF